ncbi:hypothetical protein Pan44_45020 [Caulifigura coniformis]|uniref:ORC1/DEAH AAA+ ATPase domain-containing protein n=1 Tax=Caulifigura coniformis TaxID=2527983 RepID=A0A517SK03_9PLAN|nr:AAA family ATPase [Caulifigura coniformis]QDT56448.1 hypothetical protein Pan44_45020 [Caulifigura coniformis]
MYEKFFSLSHRPFAAAPNLECIVAHEGYVDAREKLLRCLMDGCGTAVVTASPGLGKSLLCQDLQSRLRGMFTVAYLCSAQFPNRKAMLQAILFELGAEYLGLSEDEARLCIMQAAQEAADRGRSLIVIVDEAHLVSTELLQELRAIAEPSPRCATPVRLMLAGQLELEERLADQSLDSLNQRIACHAILEPLTQAESAEYILERLAIAGAKTQLFTEEAMAFMVKAADGNPRAIHQLCDHCLLSAYTIEEKPVSVETARNSLEDLRSLPLHWNDAGLLDDASGMDDETFEDSMEDDFVATVQTPLTAAGDSDLESVQEPSEVVSHDPGPLWGDSPDVGVFEVGGNAADSHEEPHLEAPLASQPEPEISDAALFASVAPWPAVPVEAIGSHELELPAPESVEAEPDEATLKLSTQIDIELSEPVSAEVMSSFDVIEPEGDEEPVMEAPEQEAAIAPPEEPAPSAEHAFTLHQPAVEWSEPDDVDESEEDTAIEAHWSRHVQFLDELEPDDFDDEEIVINDHYAALDRASQALSSWLPQAPELLQFLSQYAMKEQPRRAHEPTSSMHQSAVELAEPEEAGHEEELLATIRGLQEQLRQASVERPMPVDGRESWRQPVEYDVVQPPEESAHHVAEPVVETSPAPAVIEHEAPVAHTTAPEPVKSRFAQLFSRIRQRRREVEDRLRKNTDWI